jgi:hypothetical protein
VDVALARRLVALGGIALLAVLVALALTSATRAKQPDARRAQPGGSWYNALAAPRPPRPGARTACGLKLGPRTMGVGHPVLPCGAKLFVAYLGKEVLTQVVDRGPLAAGHDFELTRALADRVGLHGVQPIRWAFAREPAEQR